MKKNPIQFDELFNRVSGNKEFAHRMLKTFFESYQERLNGLDQNLKEENFDDLADGAHQMKGILGNLALPVGFDLLKSVHENARLKRIKPLKRNLDKLAESLKVAHEYFDSQQSLFQ